MDVTEKSFSSMVREHLGRDLPSGQVRKMDFIVPGPKERQFIRRMLGLMKKAGQTPVDIRPSAMWELSTTLPSILSGTPDGQIPSITAPGRHLAFDRYVKKSWEAGQREPGVLVDLGCGFPPFTAMDTMKNLPDWEVIGIDPGLKGYLVSDPDGHHACLDPEGNLLYFQAKMGSVGVEELYRDPEASKTRFKNAFNRLEKMRKTRTAGSGPAVYADGWTLIHEPAAYYEGGKLGFIKEDLERSEPPPADVVRAMNLLLYFRPEERRRLMAGAEKTLVEGGLFLAGTNQVTGAYRRYYVYQKEDGRLKPAEFAFSLDMLKPFSVMPWYTLHDEDPEAGLLAELAGLLRRDKDFWPDFSRRVDGLLGDYGLDVNDENNEELMLPMKIRGRLDIVWREIKKRRLWGPGRGRPGPGRLPGV